MIIAASKYSDQRLQQLRAPAADAHALGEVLRAPDIGNYELKFQINESAHLLCEEIEGFFKGRARRDQLLLYFSCHGVKNDRGRLYFATTNTRLDRLGSTGISSSFVAEQMSDCRAGHIIVILDCCYSGAFTRGMVSRAGEQVTVDDFVGSGRAVIFASSATEYAFEFDSTEIQGIGIPSVFTKAIVHGLTTGEADGDGDGQISVDDLYEFVLSEVRSILPNQTPGKWIDTSGPIFIARSALDRLGLSALPPEIRSAMSSALVGIRKGVIEELEPMLASADEATRLSARAALVQLSNDESDRVVAAATLALGIGIEPGSKASPPDKAPAGHARDAINVTAASHGLQLQQLRNTFPRLDASPEEMARWVETIQFSTTRLRPGYDEEEVDAFLDGVHDTFLGVRKPRVTADQVRNVQFRVTRLRPGYDEEEVDAFLDAVELRLAGWGGTVKVIEAP